MFIKPCYKKTNGKKLAYWVLVESYRTAKGPRHRIVAYLGQLKDATRRGVKRIADGKSPSQGQGKFEGQGQSQPARPQFVQARLFNDDPLNDDPLNDGLDVEWVEINASGVRVENEKSLIVSYFGGQSKERPSLTRC